MARLTWQVIEDNGGNLYLFVFDSDRVIYYADGYEYNPPALQEAVEELRDGADPRTNGWDLPQWVIDNDADIQKIYDDLTDQEFGWELIADHEGIYYERMGAAGRDAFKVFGDGSAIVASEGAWDIEGSEPFSWAGEE